MAISIKTKHVEDLMLETDEVITSVSYDFSSDLLGFLGTVSFLRPASEYNEMSMNLNIDIYDDPKCTNALNGNTPISNKKPNDKQYFSLFFTDGQNVNHWIDATDATVAGGFGAESAKRPIVFAIGKWLKDNKINNFSAGTKYYIVYWWTNASLDDDPTYASKANSDVNSIIWPNFENV